MKSMEYTGEELKEKPEESIAVEQPKYPYGLRIDLDKDALDKLGIDKLPEVGTQMTLNAIVEVVRVSVSEHKEGEPHKSMDLQITDMELGEVKEEKSKVEKLYGVPKDKTLDNPKNVNVEGL